MDTPCLDFLTYATGGLTLRSRPAAKGEGDTLRSIPAGVRRQLAGARFLTAGGEHADVLCDLVNATLGRDMTTCEFVSWYVQLARRAVIERRRASRRRRMAALARRCGCTSEYGWRLRAALLDGYPSVWRMRVARGWR